MVKVYDCFMFNGEWDILELRLNLQNEAVDYFVVVESNKTFTNIRKKLTFNINDARLAAFEHKIRYVLVSDMPGSEDAWQNEFYQRNAITRALWDAEPNDLIIINDCDELIKPAYIQAARTNMQFDLFGFQQPVYYCYMNNCSVGYMAEQIWSVAVRKRLLHEHDANWFRQNVRLGQAGAWYSWYWWPQAGWHYSYMMDTPDIVNKIKSFSHTEFNHTGVIDQIDPVAHALKGTDLLGRQQYEYKLIPLEALDIPAYVLHNMNTFGKYLLTT